MDIHEVEEVAKTLVVAIISIVIVRINIVTLAVILRTSAGNENYLV